MRMLRKNTGLSAHRRTLASICGVLLCLGIADAQIMMITKVGNKTILCGRSGLTSDQRDCGARSDRYTYVFVGSVLAINDIENDEKELQIAPEEVFHGDPAPSLTVLTAQA